MLTNPVLSENSDGGQSVAIATFAHCLGIVLSRELLAPQA
jgi:hypothetical protein